MYSKEVKSAYQKVTFNLKFKHQFLFFLWVICGVKWLSLLLDTFFSLFKESFIYLKNRAELQREKDNFQQLVPSADDHNDQGWTRLKTEARSFIHVCQMDVRSQSILGYLSTAFPEYYHGTGSEVDQLV